MVRTGANIVINSLCRNGTETLFGYPGGAVLPIYEELYRNSDRLRHILCAHEQNAVHAADGYARTTGRPGVVIATSGPGAANLVTGIATASLDSVPLVVITGNVSVPLLGKDSFQELDITSVTRGITKHNFAVNSPCELSRVIDAAFHIALDGRPGPVLIDIPKDVQNESCQEEDESSPLYFTRKTPLPALDALIRMLCESSRPLIYSGGGIISGRAWGELEELANRVDAPVVFSMMGLTAMRSSHPRNGGMCGMHGTALSAELLKKCDLILALGVRFSDRASGNCEKFREGKKIIHIDIDPSEINKNVSADMGITGSLKSVLTELLKTLPRQSRPEWQQFYKSIKLKNVPAEIKTLVPEPLFPAVAKYCDEDCVIVTDVGQHQIWTMHYYPFKTPGSLLTSGGLGTMGYGLGAAIGSSVARGGKRTLLFTGDGSFGMSLQELATAVSQKLPLLIIICNNGVLGMVRQWQTMFYDQHYSHTTLNRQTDFPALARAFGAEGKKITTLEELDSALQDLAPDRPTVLDCRLDKDEWALPIIPPGGSIEEMITEKKGI